VAQSDYCVQGNTPTEATRDGMGATMSVLGGPISVAGTVVSAASDGGIGSLCVSEPGDPPGRPADAGGGDRADQSIFHATNLAGVPLPC
jgi:hypothetical protein